MTSLPQQYGQPMRVPSRDVFLHPSLLPLQFPSSEHFHEAAADILEQARSVEGLAEKTLRSMRVVTAAFGRFLRESGLERGFLSGDMATQQDILERWIASLRQAGVSRISINTYWRALNAVMIRLTRRNGTVNPMRFVVTPHPGRTAPRFLTRDASERLLTFVQNYQWRSALEQARNTALIGVYLLAGLRRGEAIRLTIADVDIGARVLRVRDAKGPHGGKTRLVRFGDQLATLLAAYLRERGHARRTHPEFFTSVASDTHIGEKTVVRLFRIIVARTNISVSPHALRHTYATLLRQAGVPDRVAMDLLGHSSLLILQRYSHVHEEEYGNEVNKLVLAVDLPLVPPPTHVRLVNPPA